MTSVLSIGIRFGVVCVALFVAAGCGQSDDPPPETGSTQGSAQPDAADDSQDPVQEDGAPQISGNPPGAIVVENEYSFTPSAVDPDGDTLEFSVSNAPEWASFDPASGTLAGTPGAQDVGVSEGIEISVSDGANLVSLAVFSIEVLQMADGQAMLQWVAPVESADGSPLTDLAGYRIYYGRASGDYAQTVEVNSPGVSSYLVENLSSGPWYFAVAAYDRSDRESEMSNEAATLIE